jgi:DNA-3-methyladenine glycosylase
MQAALHEGPQPRLPRTFYRRDAIAVARGLLGQRLVCLRGAARTSGLIVETEAYLGVPDKAAHSFDGRRTARNESMWGDAGRSYVYFVYGMHHCFNVVAGEAGNPLAILVRALEPDGGEETMWRRRPKAKKVTDLCSGPAKLCQALGITRTLDGVDLVAGDRLFVEQVRRRALPSGKIGVGPRIGIAYAEEWQHEPLRFWVLDNPHVSR